MKVSVVISAFNEEKKIEECLKSVKKIASEIIFIDNTSTDKTVEIAKKYTDKVHIRENNLMLNVNKNYGFAKANGEWILNLDADEVLTEELSQEILDLEDDNKTGGYFVSRKNIIFGKWIEHTGWYPDYQPRLFRSGKGKFEEKHVHEFISIDGETKHLKNPLVHLNYESISQFLDKMVRTYTISEANALIERGYIFNFSDIYKMPLKEFFSRYFARQGYKDGVHGLSISLLMGFYHFIVYLRLWEKNGFEKRTNSLDLLSESIKYGSKDMSYWMANEKILSSRNIIKKQLFKVIRKVNS